jgi:hypothetical protein
MFGVDGVNSARPLHGERIRRSWRAWECAAMEMDGDGWRWMDMRGGAMGSPMER